MYINIITNYTKPTLISENFKRHKHLNNSDGLTFNDMIYSQLLLIISVINKKTESNVCGLDLALDKNCARADDEIREIKMFPNHLLPK